MILSMPSLIRCTYVNSCRHKSQSGKLNSAPDARGWFLGRSGNFYSFPTCTKGDTACLLHKGNPLQIPIGHCKDHLKLKCCYCVFAGKTGLLHAVLCFGYEALTGMEIVNAYQWGNNLWMQTLLLSSPADPTWRSFSETHGAVPT